MIGCPCWQSSWSLAGLAIARLPCKTRPVPGRQNFLRMPCRLEGAASVLGLGLAAVCVFRWAGDSNPRGNRKDQQ